MEFYEICIISACVLIVGGVIAKTIIDKKKGKSSKKLNRKVLISKKFNSKKSAFM